MTARSLLLFSVTVLLAAPGSAQIDPGLVGSWYIDDLNVHDKWLPDLLNGVLQGGIVRVSPTPRWRS